MTKIHLPEDIGDVPAKVGVKNASESYSFVLASDELLGYIGTFPPTTEAEKDNPIFKPASENTTDVFALTRQVKSSVLFRNVSRYDFEPEQWISQTGDLANGEEVSQGSVSVVWTNRINCRASYTSGAEVKFDPAGSSIQLKNSQNSDPAITQQSGLYTKRYFSASTSPILLTTAVKMSLSTLDTSVKTWGLYSASSGYFFRVRGNGGRDNFCIGYRSSLSGIPVDVEIKRSEFNGDKVDGVGSSFHSQSFTNVGMFGIEVGTAGVGARFWAYVNVGNSARWVLLHSLANDSDSSQDRITDEEGWPIAFENINYGASDTVQTLARFGTSVTSIGSPEGTSDVNFISASKIIGVSKTPTAVLGIKVKDFINFKKNFNSVLPLTMLAVVSSRIWMISLIKNPEKPSNPKLTFTTNNALSGVESSQTGFSILGGTLLGAYLVASNKPIRVSLTDIFSLNRNFLTAQYTNDVIFPGDNSQQFVQNADELWICIQDAMLGDGFNNEIVWSSSASVNASPTYTDPLSSGLSSDTILNITIGVQEV